MEQRLHRLHRLLGGQFEHLQVFDGAGAFPVVGGEPVVGRPVDGAGIERLAVPVVAEGPGFAQQGHDDVAEVHRRPTIAPQAGQVQEVFAAQIHFEHRFVLLDPQGVADQPGGHRIGMPVDPDQTLGADHRRVFAILGQGAARQRAHHGQLLGQGALPRRVGAAQDPFDKAVVVLQGTELAAAPQQEVLFEPALEVPVLRLDVALFVRAAHVDGHRGQIVVGAQFQVIAVVSARSAREGFQVVGGGAGIVGAQMHRAAAQLLHRGLKAGHQTQERLGDAAGGPLPVGMGQHAMAEEVIEHFPADGDLEFLGVGPIQLQQLARLPFLGEEHLLLRAVGGAPVAHPALEGAQMLWLQTAVGPGQEMVEEGPGFQFRGGLEHGLRLAPDRFERIGPGAPGVGGLKLGRALAGGEVFARGVAVHVRFERAATDVLGSLVFTHEPSILLSGDHWVAAQTGLTTKPVRSAAPRCYRLTGEF